MPLLTGGQPLPPRLWVGEHLQVLPVLPTIYAPPLWPLDFFGIAVAEICVLLTVYTVIQQYRKQRGWPNNRVTLGVILLALGMIQLPIPHIEQYAFEQIFYAVGAIVLVGPVLQQRLFDPISQLNISLKRRADQLGVNAP